MGEKAWGCLKQAAVGCGVLIGIAVIIVVVFGVLTVSPLKRAVDTRLAIEERFGPQQAYVPPASGVPSAERIEVFLGIRRALAEPCTDITIAEHQFQKMESFDDQDEVDRVEVMKQAFSTTKSVMGVGPVLGQLYETRNQSLLDAGMGLGEFTYIFAVAYGDRLLDEPEPDQLFGPAPTSRRVREALLAMLESQLEVLQSGDGTEAEIAALEAEVNAMRADDRRVPWQYAVPAAITEALAPYRSELDELYCPAMAPLELMINERRGLAIESL